MEWSHYSEAIFDTWRSTDSNIMVQACPGAGKTTNIAELWKRDEQSTLYVVFNKQNQREAQMKLAAKTASDVLTTHSLGLRAWGNTYGRPRIDEKKVIGLIRACKQLNLRYIPLELLSPLTTVSSLEWMLKCAVEKAKFSCDDVVCDDATYTNMLNVYGLEAYEGMQEDIGTILERSDEQIDVVDYDDMIRLPALYQVRMPDYDHVLCDEVQDFNSMQAQLIGKLHARKYCLVGDRHQSIYGFRGAMLNSMDYLGQLFQCVELPLSISYRCPHAVVTEAVKIWPNIEAWELAAQGEVKRYGAQDARVGEELRTVRDAREALVLCRVNAPLISYAYGLLQDGVPCHVRGRDIGQGLIKLIERFPVMTVAELVEHAQQWKQTEVAKALLVEDDAQMARVEDKASSLLALCSGVGLHEHPDVVKARIAAMFEQGKGVALSTVHKAKGLEAERCYLLEADLFGAFQARARRDGAKVQERNVEYVAVTRAQRVLVYC